MKKFTKLDTEKLINEAVLANEKGEALTNVFSRFATLTGRAEGSVRNHYYQTLKSNFNSLNLPESLRPNRVVEFTAEEEYILLKYVVIVIV